MDITFLEFSYSNYQGNLCGSLCLKFIVRDANNVFELMDIELGFYWVQALHISDFIMLNASKVVVKGLLALYNINHGYLAVINYYLRILVKF